MHKLRSSLLLKGNCEVLSIPSALGTIGKWGHVGRQALREHLRFFYLNDSEMLHIYMLVFIWSFARGVLLSWIGDQVLRRAVRINISKYYIILLSIIIIHSESSGQWWMVGDFGNRLIIFRPSKNDDFQPYSNKWLLVLMPLMLVLQKSDLLSLLIYLFKIITDTSHIKVETI